MIITFVGNFYVSYTSETHHANTLEKLGHQVIRLQEGKANSSDILRNAIESDLLVWVHTHGWKTPMQEGYSVPDIFKALKERGIPTMTYHLDLWFGLNRQKDLEEDGFYKTIGHFFTVDKKMADWFNENTEVKGHYLQAGVYEPECYIHETEKTKDVVFAGSRGYHPEWQYRPQLVDFLRKEYGDRFTHVGNDGIGVFRGEALNELYGSSKVIVGDSLCLNFDYPYYWSDRVYETLGRGGFIIHPYIKGMEKHFTDGEHLIFYEFGDFNDLRYKINYYIEHEEEREKIRLAGHNHVKKNHTYTNRWQTILQELGL
jgi:hypothetical protein